MKVTVEARDETPLTEIINRSSVAAIPNAMEILRKGLSLSEEVWFGKVDGEVACVWGLVPPTIISDRAYLWLLTTDLVKAHKFIFIRRSQIFVQKALKRWTILEGHVEAGNYKAKRWLRWLGAKFGTPDGVRIPFEIRG